MEKKRSVTPNGDAIRSARLRKAWTTDDLSGRVDCAVKTIENAERGKAIYANTLASIARALGVEYDSLVAMPVEQKKPMSEQKKPTKLDLIISTTRVDACFGMLAREDQQIDTDWFLDQLKSHVAFKDAVDVISNGYQKNTAIPEGGIWITLKMTVRDFDQVYKCFCAKCTPDEPFLKVVFLAGESIPNPHIPNDFLWRTPLLRYSPPHSHLYD